MTRRQRGRAPWPPGVPAEDHRPAVDAAPARASPAEPGQRPAGRDRGSAAVIMVVFGFIFIGLAAFVVDGGLLLANKQRAEDVAEQAARYAAQALDEEQLRSSGTVVIDKGACESRIARFVGEFEFANAGIGQQSCLTHADPADAITVEVRVTYTPAFSGLFVGEQQVTGRSTAQAEAG